MVTLLNPQLTRRMPKGLSPITLIQLAVGATQWAEFLGELNRLQLELLKYEWDLYARSNQRPPIDREWAVWFPMSGRGWGKTRVGAQQVIQWAEELGRDYGAQGHIALVGKDPADIRDVMIEGAESGILACSPPWFYPKWEPSLRQLTWPNGVQAHYYSSETPDILRGPQHHKAWGDEPGKWKKAQETWDNLMLGLRLGDKPQTIVTGTPRPTPLIKDIVSDPDTVVTRGETNENLVNLSELFMKRVYRRYHGTRLGRQELSAELLGDTPGALWTLDMIDRTRVPEIPPDLESVVIALDPNVTDRESDPQLMESDDLAECGIVAAGRGPNKHFYVMHDFSGPFSPNSWGMRACSHYETLKADRIVGEQNNGGDLVKFVVEECAKSLGFEVAYKKVIASRGKRTRAEPVSALWEQGRGHICGLMPELEDQMSTWVPGDKSPDRMDAMVWAAFELVITTSGELLYV